MDVSELRRKHVQWLNGLHLRRFHVYSTTIACWLACERAKQGRREYKGGREQTAKTT